MPFHYTWSFVRYRLFLLFVKSEYNLVVVQILVKNAQRSLKRKSAELHFNVDIIQRLVISCML